MNSKSSLPWLFVIFLAGVLLFMSGWIPGFHPPATPPANWPTTIVPTQEPLGPGQNALATAAALANALNGVLPTATLGPLQSSPTAGPTATPVPIVIRMDGNLAAVQNLLNSQARSYQTHLETVAIGSYGAVGNAQQNPTFYFWSPGFSEAQVTAVLWGEIHGGFTWVDWWGDQDVSFAPQDDWQETGEVTNVNGQEIKISRRSLVIKTNVFPCITGVMIASKGVELTAIKEPGTIVKTTAGIMGVNYDMVGLAQNAYQDAYAQLVSEDRVASVLNMAADAAKPGGILYQDFKSLMEATGGFREITIEVSMPTEPWQQVYCQDGSPVQPAP